MTAALVRDLRISLNQLLAVARCARVDDLPTVLAVRSRESTIDEREAVLDQAGRELEPVGLISDGALHPALSKVMGALGRPDRELAMRVVTPGGRARISAARRAQLCVLASRRGDEVLGSVLASRQAWAEIVYYALLPDEGRVVRGPAAVAVFYTERGRIVSAPRMSPTGQLWVTLKPGSDYVCGQAIGQLVDVSHPWGDH